MTFGFDRSGALILAGHTDDGVAIAYCAYLERRDPGRTEREVRQYADSVVEHLVCVV